MMLLGVVNVMSQETEKLPSQQTEIPVDSLMIRINKLQHNYDCLECKFELQSLIFELKDLSNEISISSNNLLLYYLTSQMDIDFYTSYLSLYNAKVDSFNSSKEKVDLVKVLVSYKMLLSDFSELELNVISQSFNSIDSLMSLVDQSLQYFKVVIDSYKSKL
jgi:hypothetical protein